jgi:hypothetical protein
MVLVREMIHPQVNKSPKSPRNAIRSNGIFGGSRIARTGHHSDENYAFSVLQKRVGDSAYWFSSLLDGAGMEVAQVGYAGPPRRPVAVPDGQLQQMQVELESVIKVFYEIFSELTPAERAFYQLPASTRIQ